MTAWRVEPSSIRDQPVRPDGATRGAIVIPVVLLALLSASYFFAAMQIAAGRPFWMDEVLAVWTARLPDVAAIWDALNKGAEFSPPLYHLFLQKVIQLGGGSALALRLPSTVAVYVVGVAAFILVRRRYCVAVAALAMALCLTGGLFPFGLQVRQYAGVVACFAVALVIWDVPVERTPSWRNATTMLVLLTIAVGMHFYAVLVAASVGLMELIWTAVHRRIRWLHIGAIGMACCSVLLWLPIMRHIAAFNLGDVDAPAYYARPMLSDLPDVYYFLAARSAPVFLALLAVLCTGAAEYVLVRRRGGGLLEPRKTGVDNLDIIVGVTCAIPVLVFVFSVVVTHTYNLRYVIAAALGLSVLAARLVAMTRWSAAFSNFVVCIAIGATLNVALAPATDDPLRRALALLERAPPHLPVVTGNGLRFLEMREGAGAAAAGRLFYLKSPAGTASPDPTNEHQVERWKTIAPNLAVMDVAPFVAAHRRFVLFRDASAVDLLPGLLAGRGYRLSEIARDGDAYLAEVETSPVNR